MPQVQGKMCLIIMAKLWKKVITSSILLFHCNLCYPHKKVMCKFHNTKLMKDFVVQMGELNFQFLGEGKRKTNFRETNFAKVKGVNNYTMPNIQKVFSFVLILALHLVP